MIFSSRSRSILAAYCWGGDVAKIARRSNAACSPPTATRSPTRCPPKPCSPCPNSTACCRCPTRPCTLPPEARGGDAVPDHRSLREEREQFYRNQKHEGSKIVVISRGTGGSNPLSSSRQSVSLPQPLFKVENPAFPRGSGQLAWRPGQQRRARLSIARQPAAISLSAHIPVLHFR